MKPNAYIMNIRDQRELRNKASLAHQILQISCPMGPLFRTFPETPTKAHDEGGPYISGCQWNDPLMARCRGSSCDTEERGRGPRPQPMMLKMAPPTVP